VASQPFEQVVQEHGPTVLRVCRSLLGEHEAQDAWAETFLSALRAYPELPEGSNVVGWLVTIAHRRSIDQLRVASRSPVPSATLPENATRCAGAGGGLLDDPLRVALRSLPPKQRGAVIYRYLADMSYEDVGELIGSSPTAARRSAADGIAALRRARTEGVM
jgi:DNA-directed RNA polymerase specialized sigma24 family protein